jgi:hypothetical protein
MRRVVQGLFNLAMVGAVAGAAWWAWQAFTDSPRGAGAGQVLDVDKQCNMVADTGQCMCRHRATNERLAVPYEECVERARRP